MEKFSVVIICKNEELNIRRCLESASWADEIVVYDHCSTDKTVDICREFNCSLYTDNPYHGQGLSYQAAINKAKYDWVLVLDADEVVTDELKVSIQKFMENPTPNVAFNIKRESFFMGQKIKYSGWQRDLPMKFFNRTNGNYNDKPIDANVVLNCPRKIIDGVLLHYTYPSVQNHITKLHTRSVRWANFKYSQGKKTSITRAILGCIGKFIKMYIINLGFLDGKRGLILAINSSFGIFIKYIYLWEKNQ